jgi:hypothetical protein
MIETVTSIIDASDEAFMLFLITIITLRERVKIFAGNCCGGR